MLMILVGEITYKFGFWLENYLLASFTYAVNYNFQSDHWIMLKIYK